MTVRAWTLLLAMLLALFPAVMAVADEAGFSILRAELKPADTESGGYWLEADIDYRFSEPVIDALRNGVSLTLMLRLGVREERAWWWDALVLDEKRSFRVRYHALSKLYQIVYDESAPPQNFVSIQALLEAMGALRNMPVSNSPRLMPGGRYRARLTVGLDIESLPLPLRPVAYLTSSWYLDSPPYQWTFVN